MSRPTKFSRNLPSEPKVGRKPWRRLIPPEGLGHWVIDLDGIARRRGIIHTSGPQKGHVNLYKIAKQTGISEPRLVKLYYGQSIKNVGLETIGKLCDYFQCQPHELLRREAGVVPEGYVVPDRTARREATKDSAPRKREPEIRAEW